MTAAGYYDLRWRRVPNWLVGLTLFVALVWHGVGGGWSGLGASVMALFAGVLAFFPFFAIRAMGAGDVKFVGALGAMVTLPRLLPILVISLFVAAGMALWYVLRRGLWASTLRHLGELLQGWSRGRFAPHPVANIDHADAVLVPFTLAAAISTWVVFAIETVR